MSRQTTLATAVLLAACSAETDDRDPQTHRVTIYGEAFIEEGIPAGETDGWAIAFDQFLVAVDGVKAGDAVVSGQRVFDLTAASSGVGQPVGDLADGPHDELAYRIGPASGAVAGNATAEQVRRMNDGGWSMWVSGTATREGVTKTFAWGFATDTRYAPCHTAPAEDGDAVRSMLTIHADHLFYDDLVSETPNVAFQLVADADTDGDGTVTSEELRAVDITSLDRYQVGNADDITNLWQFIEAQSRTVGHIDGEGHCESDAG